MTKFGVSLDALLAEGVDCFYKKQNAPEQLVDAIYNFKSGPDVLTPLEMGKEQFLAHLVKHQPKTGRALLNGSELFAALKTRIRPPLRPGMAPSVAGGLYLETHGRVIELGAMAFSHKSLDTSMTFGLPSELKQAYYLDGHVQGMGLLTDPSNISMTDFLPTLLSNGWAHTNTIVSGLRGVKTIQTQLVERFDLKPQSSGDYYDLRCFLKRKGGDKDVNEALIVHVPTQEIFHMTNRDILGMRVLQPPIEALDDYCSHVISTGMNDFSFEEYLGEKVF
jgi:hypothetical protein